ncbi:MAG: DNA topoisomerase IB [Gemmatimonadota bacterium]
MTEETETLTEHQAAARDAGLIYVMDSSPGIRRKRSGKGWSYTGLDGQPLRDKVLLQRMKGLVIPPAWTDVWISPDPHGHIQVTARDAKGRKQYRYHFAYRAVRDETKFERLFEFSEILPGIRAKVEKDLAKTGYPREKILATVVRLLEKTLIRIGNEEYAKENRSYGLTTMRQRHVEVEGSEIVFEFRGKSGVKHEVKVADRRVAKIVQHCQTLPGEELFQYVDPDTRARRSLDSGDINEYLGTTSGREVTAKDFRTWAGTMLAARQLRELGPAPSERQAKLNIIKAVDVVAKKLGNTRAVCRKYYVHPVIFEAYMEGQTIPPSPVPDLPAGPRTPGPPALRHDERNVLEFIRARQAAVSPKP